MKLTHRKSLLAGLVLLGVLSGLVSGAGLLFSDRVLDGVVRPRLVRMAAARLQAEVGVEHLVWEDGGLTLTELTVERPDRYRISLARMRIIPSFRDLLRRRLSAVELTDPHVEITPSPASGAGFALPAEPPFIVGRLLLRGGRFTYAHSTHPITLHDINAAVQGGNAFEFTFAAQVSKQAPIAIAANGTGRWRRGLQLQLATLQWHGRSLLREPLMLSLPADQGGHLRLALTFDDVERSDVEQWLAAFSIAASLPPGWDFSVNDLRLAADWQAGMVDAELSIGQGLLKSSAVQLPLASLALTARRQSGSWLGEGRFALDGGATGTLGFQIGAASPQGALTLTVPDPTALQKLVLGRIALPVAGAAHLAVEGGLPEQGARLSFILQGKPARGAPTRASLDISALTLSGGLNNHQGHWQVEAGARLAGKSLATLAGDMQRLRAKLLTTPWSRLQRLLPVQSRPQWLQVAQGLSAEAVLVRGKQGWQADATGRAERVAARHGTLRDLVVTGHIATAGPRVLLSRGNLRGRVSHDRLGQGLLQARFDASQAQGGGWEVRFSTLDLSSLELMSADGLAGLAGGRLHLQGRMCRVAVTAPLELRVHGRMSASEALWGSWYGQLDTLPVDFAVFANWHPHRSRLELLDLKIDTGGLALVRAQGECLPDATSLSGSLKIADLAKAWDGRGRALVRELRPALGDLGLAGGLEARLTLRGAADRWHLQGEMRLQELAATWPRTRLTLRGGHGTIPLDLVLPADAGQEGGIRRGQLSFEHFVFGPVRLAAGPLQLAVGPNRCSLENSLRLSVAGGQVSIEQLRAGYAASGLQLETRIRLAEIDLHLLTSELGMVPMEGAINADLGHIRYADGVLRSDGEVLVEAFGGALQLRNLQLDPISLGLPQFQADLDLTGIDLYLLTQTFAFGAMHGVVDGKVRELHLYGATPSHFSAQLQTRLEGRRSISVKALNNLSILSQGGLSAALSRGVYRFIDFYRYRRIGLDCNLREDVFTLRGTARPDSRRYLVDGGLLPPKIDIVAPERPISFREMLRRLKRIDRTGRGAD